MTDDELRLLGDISAGLPSTFDYLYFEVARVDGGKPIVAGDRIEGHLHASDLPGDPRTLIDAVPQLVAEVKRLRQSRAELLTDLRRGVAVVERLMADQGRQDEALDALGVELVRKSWEVASPANEGPWYGGSRAAYAGAAKLLDTARGDGPEGVPHV